MITNLTIALAISLTGQVEDAEDVYEWVCQGEAQGFKHRVTNKITCDGTNHEEWEKHGKLGECYVCY